MHKLWYEYFLLDRSKEQVSKYSRVIRRDVDKDGNILPPPRPGENTKYDQDKFMNDKLLRYFSSDSDRETILEDFRKVRDMMYELRLNSGKNIGHYEYLIIRPACRNEIEIRELTEEEVSRMRERKIETYP